MTMAGRSQMAERVDETVKGTQQQVEDLERRLEKVREERDAAVEVSENLRKETMNTKQEL